MSDPAWDLAALVVKAAGGQPIEGLTGTVVSDDGGGKVTVDLGATTPTPGIPRLASYGTPVSGDLVLVLLVGGSPWVLGVSAVS